VIGVATVREGNQRALLVVDMQIGVLDGTWDAERVVANVARAVEGGGGGGGGGGKEKKGKKVGG
jgi:hypothetical protein